MKWIRIPFASNIDVNSCVIRFALYDEGESWEARKKVLRKDIRHSISLNNVPGHFDGKVFSLPKNQLQQIFRAGYGSENPSSGNDCGANSRPSKRRSARSLHFLMETSSRNPGKVLEVSRFDGDFKHLIPAWVGNSSSHPGSVANAYPRRNQAIPGVARRRSDGR